MSGRAAGARILMDVTALICWTGRPTGIVRVERELATWARHNRHDVEFVVFDPRSRTYRAIHKRWLDKLLAGHGVLTDSRRPRFIEGLPARIQTPAMWLLQFRRQLLVFLEDRRTATRRVRLVRFIDRLQRSIASGKYRRQMFNPDGSRREIISRANALARTVEFRPCDILLSVGSAWVNSNIAAIAEEKRRRHFRYAVFCHDLILLQFPQNASPLVVENFRNHIHNAFPICDLVLCASRRVEEDVRSYCRDQEIELKKITRVPFGASPASLKASSTDLRQLGLTAGHFILHVSTIEPRKGHRMLLEAWQRLLAQGLPQTHGYKLVMVGQIGWKVEELHAELEMQAASGSLLLLSNADDALLGALYRDAAFCVYPSQYEGYGLPLVEAFGHGKAVITSTGGALPEIAGNLAPCLDPGDVTVWTEMMARWITDTAARRVYEEAIRSYRPMTWDAAARQFFATLENELETATGGSDVASGID